MQVLWYDPADRIVSHTELARGNVHLRTWNAEFFIVLSPDHGCRISGGSYPSPTKPNSLGIKKTKTSWVFSKFPRSFSRLQHFGEPLIRSE